MTTRTEVITSEEIRTWIPDMESSGWEVKLITPFCWGEVNDNLGLIQAVVVFERTSNV